MRAAVATSLLVLAAAGAARADTIQILPPEPGAASSTAAPAAGCGLAGVSGNELRIDCVVDEATLRRAASNGRPDHMRIVLQTRIAPSACEGPGPTVVQISPTRPMKDLPTVIEGGAGRRCLD